MINHPNRAKKSDKSIVFCPDYNGFEALFMMKHDDFRFGTENYKTITTGRHDRKEGRFYGENGHVYRVFSDWSARDLTMTAEIASALKMKG
jgi:hypothetical protein